MGFPNQRLTVSEKKREYGSIKNWAKEVHRSIDGLSKHNTPPYASLDMQENYALIEGKFDVDSFSDITKRFGDGNYTMPAELEHYDIMSAKYELLRGEHSRRPFNFRALQTNPEVVTRLSEMRKSMNYEAMVTRLRNKLIEDGLVEGEIEEAMTPEQVDKYIAYTYRDKAEVFAQQSLNYLIPYLHLEHKMNSAWEHYLKGRTAICCIEDINNEPHVRIVDPRFCDYDLSHGEQFIESCSWIREWRYLTASDVYDEFHSELTDDDVKFIEGIKGNAKFYHLDPRYHVLPFDDTDRGFGASTFKAGNDTIVKVVRTCWRGLKPVFIVSGMDNYGDAYERVVDEDYVPIPGEQVRKEWANEWWEVTCIGNDVFTKIRPIPNQFANLDNLNKGNCPYVGIRGSYSIVSKMKPYQLLFNVFMYHLKLDFATAIGNVGIFDIAQIPTSEGFDIDKWLYYLKTFRIGFINSKEENKKGEQSSFNTHKQIDMSVAASVQYNIAMLDKIKEMMAELVGISPQREGAISSTETVGGVERSVAQSNFITESLFYEFNEFKRRVLERLVDVSKVAWKNGKKGQYVMPDEARVFFDIDPTIYNNANIGIFITNSSQDNEAYQAIKGLAQEALQNGMADLLDIAEVYTSNSTTQIKHKLQEARDRTQQQREQEQAANNQAMMGAEQERTAREKMIQDREDARAKDKNATAIRVAQISAMGFDEEKDYNNTGIPDVLEIEKLASQERIKQAELRMKDDQHQRELQQNEKFHKDEMKIKEKEVAVKKIAAKKKPKTP